MRIRTRIFLGLLAVIGVGLVLFLHWIVRDLEPQYRKATEEPLIDTARLLASAAGETATGGEVDVAAFRRVLDDVRSRPFSARIYDHVKTETDLRVSITDRNGIVLFDSRDPANEGRNFSRWLDVSRTLQGEYGARTTRDDPGDPATAVMYIGAPIVVAGRTAGVLTVGKPTRAARTFFENSRRKIVVAGVVVFASMILVVVLVSAMVTRPIRDLTGYARAVRDGGRAVLPRLGTSEVRELGEAFEEMRDALEGRQYVERYVQALTHEIKSPLSAIRGAAELLGEEMPPEQRARFLENIGNESLRIEGIIEKLLLLASLETRKAIRSAEDVDLREIVDDVTRGMETLLEERRIRIDVAGEGSCVFEGEPFLVRHAVANLLQNAVDFSPDGGRVAATVSRAADGSAALAVRDRGAGIPEYALPKVFERFYSLKRPGTGKKSSGLGLALVKEVALLHRGAVSLENAPGGGAVAVLRFPAARGRAR